LLLRGDVLRLDAVDVVTVQVGRLDGNGAVGGYFVLEADDLAAAIELASRIPAARHGGAIEVRPVATYW
jgi:hypothetical protein